MFGTQPIGRWSPEKPRCLAGLRSLQVPASRAVRLFVTPMVALAWALVAIQRCGVAAASMC